MRVTSDLFVSALLRRVFSSGGFAAIERKGAREAGSIFIRQRFRDGRETLYSPAPQSLVEDDGTRDRIFERRLDRVAAETIAEIIVREQRFDPDLWVVEIEAEEIGDLLSVVEP